jgi:hypothetical protein
VVERPFRAASNDQPAPRADAAQLATNLGDGHGFSHANNGLSMLSSRAQPRDLQFAGCPMFRVLCETWKNYVGRTLLSAKKAPSLRTTLVPDFTVVERPFRAASNDQSDARADATQLLKAANKGNL